MLKASWVRIHLMMRAAGIVFPQVLPFNFPAKMLTLKTVQLFEPTLQHNRSKVSSCQSQMTETRNWM